MGAENTKHRTRGTEPLPLNGDGEGSGGIIGEKMVIPEKTSWGTQNARIERKAAMTMLWVKDAADKGTESRHVSRKS